MDIDSDVSTAYCSSSKISSTAARFVTGVKTFEHITLALVELHWLPVPYRIVFKLLLVVYKVINGLCSALLNIWRIFCTMRNRQGTYVQTRVTYLCSQSQELRLVKTGPFAVCALRIWNSLPLNIRHSSSDSSFQKNLKTFFLNILLRVIL